MVLPSGVSAWSRVVHFFTDASLQPVHPEVAHLDVAEGGAQSNQKVSGTLIANNGCTKGPQSDAYFVSIEGYYAARFHPGSSLGWQFVQSAGFTSLGVFRRQGHSYTFTNAVGDSFKFTPRYAAKPSCKEEYAHRGPGKFCRPECQC